MLSKKYIVEFSKFAAKQMDRLPKELRKAVNFWEESVKILGLPQVRKMKSYHDEPLKGQRSGERSIRLNRSYRLIYREFDQGEIVVIGVQEVNKHGY